MRLLHATLGSIIKIKQIPVYNFESTMLYINLLLVVGSITAFGCTSEKDAVSLGNGRISLELPPDFTVGSLEQLPMELHGLYEFEAKESHYFNNDESFLSLSIIDDSCFNQTESLMHKAEEINSVYKIVYPFSEWRIDSVMTNDSKQLLVTSGKISFSFSEYFSTYALSCIKGNSLIIHYCIKNGQSSSYHKQFFDIIKQLKFVEEN